MMEFVPGCGKGLCALGKALDRKMMTFSPSILAWVGRIAPAGIRSVGGLSRRNAWMHGVYGGDMDVRAFGRTHRDGTDSRVHGSIRRRGNSGFWVGSLHSGW